MSAGSQVDLLARGRRYAGQNRFYIRRKLPSPSRRILGPYRPWPVWCGRYISRRSFESSFAARLHPRIRTIAAAKQIVTLLLRVIVEAKVDPASHPRETAGILDGLRSGPFHFCRVERVELVFHRAVMGNAMLMLVSCL